MGILTPATRGARTTRVIRNATLKFVRIAFPKVDPWGKEVYELAIVTDDHGQKGSWEAMALNVKPLGERESIVNFKKYAKSKSGNDLPAPAVLDRFKNVGTIDPLTIGDGTIADVKIMQYASSDSPTGTASVLVAIMVTDLVEYDSITEGF